MIGKIWAVLFGWTHLRNAQPFEFLLVEHLIIFLSSVVNTVRFTLSVRFIQNYTLYILLYGAEQSYMVQDIPEL